MNYVLAALVLIVPIWIFLRINTSRGVKSVRAYLFLSSLEAGKTVEQAKQAADIDPKNIRKALLPETMNYLDAHYGRNQLAMIRAAREKGLEL